MKYIIILLLVLMSTFAKSQASIEYEQEDVIINGKQEYKLSWKANHYKFSKFVIERTNDGDTWNKIGEVIGDNKNHYSFIDHDPTYCEYNGYKITAYRFKIKVCDQQGIFVFEGTEEDFMKIAHQHKAYIIYSGGNVHRIYIF